MELEGALTEIVDTAMEVSRTETMSIILKIDRVDMHEIEQALQCCICKGNLQCFRSAFSCQVISSHLSIAKWVDIWKGEVIVVIFVNVFAR